MLESEFARTKILDANGPPYMIPKIKFRAGVRHISRKKK